MKQTLREICVYDEVYNKKSKAVYKTYERFMIIYECYLQLR